MFPDGHWLSSNRYLFASFFETLSPLYSVFEENSDLLKFQYNNFVESSRGNATEIHFDPLVNFLDAYTLRIVNPWNVFKNKVSSETILWDGPLIQNCTNLDPHSKERLLLYAWGRWPYCPFYWAYMNNGLRVIFLIIIFIRQIHM